MNRYDYSQSGAGGELDANEELLVQSLDSLANSGASQAVRKASSTTVDNVNIPAAAGDVSSNTSSSVDSEIALFSGTGGKTIKRASITGLLKAAAGVIAAAVAGTDYYAPGSTDVAVADGGTGASDASGARTNLGLGSAATEADTKYNHRSNNLSDVANAATAFGNIKQGASDSATGVVELATAAETTTGTDANRAVTPDGLAGSDYGKRVVGILVVDPATNTATGDGKAFFRVPSVMNGWNLVGVAASVFTAGTTNTTDVQIRNVTQTADMLTTKLTIDSAEVDTSTAASAAVIDTNNDDVATGDRIAIDVDAVSTTPAKGLFVELIFQLP